MTSTTPQRRGLLDRVGFPRGMGWGLLAVVLFMIGDGIESTWLSNYLVTNDHYSLGQAGWVITAYGIVVAIGAFLSGALADAIGPRRVMTLGLVSFVVFDLLFILVGLTVGNYWLLIVVYCLRGLGYPLFGYGFLTWMMYRAQPGKESSTAGWFWFAFSLGSQILGSYAASALLPTTGAVATLWAGLGAVVVGGVGGLLLIRGGGSTATGDAPKVGAAIWQGLSIIWRVPKVGLGGLVKVINLSGILAFSVFYVPYLVGTIKMAEGPAILVFTVLGIFAVIGNLVWGFIGDVLGWRRTTQWFATTLCFIAVLWLFYVPQLVGPNFALVAVGGIIMGAGLSAFVPITALMAGFAPTETGSALSIVNLGSGLAAFVGPAIASIFVGIVGIGGVVWILAGMYAAAFVIMAFLRLPGDAKTTASIPTNIVAETPATTI
jgi:predicted MFS family arabinose efflux permease